MKTQDLLISHKRTENVARILSVVSLNGVIVGIIFGFLYLIYKNPIYDTLAVYGLTLFILPFVLLQFFMTAGFYGNGLGWIYVLFYLVLFPFVDIWFFSGINAIFQIIPNYHIKDTLARTEFIERSWLFIVGTYLLVNGAGLLWRIGKNTTRRNAPVLLSL
jgi:hypothetical protein